jgi:hypothetical protein
VKLASDPEDGFTARKGSAYVKSYLARRNKRLAIEARHALHLNAASGQETLHVMTDFLDIIKVREQDKGGIYSLQEPIAFKA